MPEEILGVKIDNIDLTESLSRISDFLNSASQHYLVTINPEFIVTAQNNQAFKNILNSADLAICDGFGLVLASRGRLKRVTGVDLSQKLIEGQLKEARIFLLGGGGESAEILMAEYPPTVVGAKQGGIINNQTFLLADNEIVLKKINSSGANILLVGFGQVKQENWITRNLIKMPDIKVAIGVGGTFDYLSGRIRRAPQWLRVLGLEWLFRLVTQPQRLGRIFNATVKFLWLVVFKKG